METTQQKRFRKIYRNRKGTPATLPASRSKLQREQPTPPAATAPKCRNNPKSRRNLLANPRCQRTSFGATDFLEVDLPNCRELLFVASLCADPLRVVCRKHPEAESKCLLLNKPPGHRAESDDETIGGQGSSASSRPIPHSERNASVIGAFARKTQIYTWNQ